MAQLFDSLVAQTRLRTFVQYLVASCSRPEAASEVMSDRFVQPIVLDKRVKFCSRLNHSRQIRTKAIGGGIYEFFCRNNFRPEVVSDCISGVAIEWVGMDVCIKFGDIRAAHFVMDERTTPADAGQHVFTAD